jgi:hypothetical protein
MHILAGLIAFCLLVVLCINIARATNHSKYEKKLESSALVQEFLNEIRKDSEDVKMISIRNRSFTIDRFSENDYDYQFDIQTRQMTKSEMKMVAEICCRTFPETLCPYQGGEYLITIKSRAYSDKLSEAERTKELKNPFF